MKLKKLIMSAFGPYAERQELDFESNLDGKNMFVITGNTGAGKTTIFDAINFALYGEASGSDREGKSLRSDFADSQTPTEVELWFSLRNKEYYVKRSPQYFRAKQRGEGLTENKPSAELKIGEQKTITGPKEVSKEIENILGITAEQFKQLVMIPQGEFKKLLTSDSDKKEDIFRKIFGTKSFSDIQQNIKDKGNGLRRTIEQVQRDRENRIRAFKCGDHEELLRLISAKDLDIESIMTVFEVFIEGEEGRHKKLEEELKNIDDNIMKISKEINLGTEINKKLEHTQKSKEALEKQEEQISVFEVKKLFLDRGKKAITVQGYEEKYNEKYKWNKSLKSQLEFIEKKLQEYKKNYKEAEKIFLKEQGREDEKAKLIEELKNNEKLKEKVVDYENNKRQVESLYNEVKGISTRIEEIGKLTVINNEKIDKINLKIEGITKAKEKKGQLSLKELNATNKEEKLKKLNADLMEWENNKSRHEKGSIAYEKKDEEYELIKKEYESLEDAFRRNQAGLLAKDLKKGYRCPVCGSTEHPELAMLEDINISEESVKESKLSFEKVSKQRQDYLNELTNINSKMQSLEETAIIPVAIELLGREVIGFDENGKYSREIISNIKPRVNELLQEVELQIREVKKELQELNQIIDKENLILNERISIENNNKALALELEDKNKELLNKQGELKGSESNLENIKKDFKGDIKTREELQLIGAKLSNQIEEIKNAYFVAEKAFNLSKSILDKEKGKYDTTKKNLEDASRELNEILEIFKTKVLELGFFDYKDYAGAKLGEEQISLIEKEISDFNIKLSNAKSMYDLALKESEGLKKLDLTEMEEKLKIERNAKVNLGNESKNVFSIISHNKGIFDDCKRLTKNIKSDEEEYKVIGKLAKIVNGDNDKKISFERYVLAAYFEDIIDAANLRFSKMTANRYELSRKEEVGDRRKGSGLDLEVFDNYTGKKRDVKTLSGGESFKASLSMALGLADVVQSYAGGIQLDTMFIDEGFGTLDPESLDNAIDCLIDLQNDGRVVGVISHVQELKDRIDTRLEVSSTNKGSKAEFI